MARPADGFIAVDQLRTLLRNRGYKFRRDSRSGRTALWSHPTTQHRVNVPKSDLIPVSEVRVMLGQAGMSKDEIERFFGECRS